MVNTMIAPISALLKWLADMFLRLRSWVVTDWDSDWLYEDDDD